MGASDILRNFVCLFKVTLKICLHICHQFIIVCKLCPLATAASRTVDWEKRNNQTISSTCVMEMLDFWIRLSDLKWKKADPASSQSSLWQERSDKCQMFERFLRRRSTMVLWYSNPPFPGPCIVFLSTLGSRSIRNASSSPVTSCL